MVPYQLRLKHSRDRDYWLELLDTIASPVLYHMSRGKLQKNMPVEFSPDWKMRAKRVAYLEAFGRLIAGIAPFLELSESSDTHEEEIRTKLTQQTLASIEHAVNPKSTDYLYWGSDILGFFPGFNQPLVDVAYFVTALVVAPKTLWNPLDRHTKQHIIRELYTVRKIKPCNNNWLLFSAMIETFLLMIGENGDVKKIDHAIDGFQGWYAGDGWYSDGEGFSFDHYNGYTIHPFLTEILKQNTLLGRRKKQEYDQAYKRMQRYASFQERFISPEGTYPVFGRSSIYRAGAFWPLVKCAYENRLPKDIFPEQVRPALTSVLKNLFVPATFRDGWLTLGLVGDQQANIADYYSNTGSTYITALVFWALGLPAKHRFWSGEERDWTQKKAWSGSPFPKDYKVDY